MSTFSEAPHPVKGEVSSAGYPHGELTATGRRASGFDFGRLSILPLPATLIQTNLAINTLGDEYDQEADQVSERVMHMSEPRLQHKCALRRNLRALPEGAIGRRTPALAVEARRHKRRWPNRSPAYRARCFALARSAARCGGACIYGAALWPRLFPSTSALRRSCRAIGARRERSRLYRRTQGRVCRRSIRTEDSPRAVNWTPWTCPNSSEPSSQKLADIRSVVRAYPEAKLALIVAVNRLAVLASGGIGITRMKSPMESMTQLQALQNQ